MRVTSAQLRDALSYDPDTGVFTWKKPLSNRVKVGDVAGRVGERGYVVIGFAGKMHRAHRLAWLYMTGDWPSQQIDHRNGVRFDNRWANLRDVSGEDNQRNRHRANRNNTSGLQGVSATIGGFFARIYRDGKTRYLGYFRTAREAAAAYQRAKAGG